MPHSANTLAYQDTELIMAVKSFIVLAPKLKQYSEKKLKLSDGWKLCHNKLECFGSNFDLILIFAGKEGAYLSGAPDRIPLNGQAPALPANNRLNKNACSVKHSSLSWYRIYNGRKKFYSTGT